jgi:hypothetical protein
VLQWTLCDVDDLDRFCDAGGGGDATIAGTELRNSTEFLRGEFDCDDMIEQVN